MSKSFKMIFAISFLLISYSLSSQPPKKNSQKEQFGLAASFNYNLSPFNFGNFWEDGIGFFAETKYMATNELSLNLQFGYQQWASRLNTDQNTGMQNLDGDQLWYINVPVLVGAHYYLANSTDFDYFIGAEMGVNQRNMRRDQMLPRDVNNPNSPVARQRFHDRNTVLSFAPVVGAYTKLGAGFYGEVVVKYTQFFDDLTYSVNFLGLSAGIVYRFNLTGDKKEKYDEYYDDDDEYYEEEDEWD